MKNCPVCHYEYDADKCPECGWPDTATKHGLDDLISWADDGGRFIWLDEAIGELSTLRENATKVDKLRKLIEEDEKLLGNSADRIIQLESAMLEMLNHFSVSSFNGAVIYDMGISVDDLKRLVEVTGLTIGFQEVIK